MERYNIENWRITQEKTRSKYHEEEHKLQVACVKWFRLMYPTEIIYAIPNGGRRDKTTGAKLKAEGVLAGVPDLQIMRANKTHHGLYIEMKTQIGRLSRYQMDFKMQATSKGYEYRICRSLEDFKNIITEYYNEI